MIIVPYFNYLYKYVYSPSCFIAKSKIYFFSNVCYLNSLCFFQGPSPSYIPASWISENPVKFPNTSKIGADGGEFQ